MSRNKSPLITPCLPFLIVLPLSLVFAPTPSFTLPVSRLPRFPRRPRPLASIFFDLYLCRAIIQFTFYDLVSNKSVKS